MKYAIRYQSRNGNTKAVADYMADKLNVNAKPISEPLDEYADMLFIGGGVYGWTIDKELKEYLENLDKNRIGCIVAFSTTGMQEFAITHIKKHAEKAGIPVYESSFVLKLMMQGHALLKLEGGHLKDEQKRKIDEFMADFTA